MLPRKASKLQVIRDRTENRLRWAAENAKVIEITLVKELGKITP